MVREVLDVGRIVGTVDAQLEGVLTGSGRQELQASGVGTERRHARTTHLHPVVDQFLGWHRKPHQTVQGHSDAHGLACRGPALTEVARSRGQSQRPRPYQFLLGARDGLERELVGAGGWAQMMRSGYVGRGDGAVGPDF